jgi:elongation factor Ts
MAEIKAKDVMELRKATGLGMMECKKALEEAEGDFDKAVEVLRKKGLAKAAKRAEREAKEGIIKIVKTDDRHGVMLVLNSETDFVSRSDDFKAAVEELAGYFAKAEVPADCLGKSASHEHIENAIAKMPFKGSTVGEELTQLSAKTGEKIQLGHIVLERSADAGDYLQEYLHGNRVGVLVCLTTGKPETHANPKFHEVAKDIAMQAAAGMPRVAEAVSREDLDPALIEKEKAILIEQANVQAQEGGGRPKPADVVEKMVEGRMGKLFFGEVCLIEQPFIKDDKLTVKDVIAAAEKELGDTIKVARFHRFQLGE